MQATSLLPAFMLLTGTAVTIVTQVFLNQNVVHSSSHVLAWIKYVGPLGCNAVLKLCSRKRAQSTVRKFSPQSQKYLWLIGGLDIFAYILLSIAYAACGSALTSVVFAAANQICNAAASTLVQKKTLSPQQATAVVVVVFGLSLRAAPLLDVDGSNPAAAFPTAMLASPEALGIVAMLLAAVAYGALGVAYERMLALEGPTVSHAQIGQTIAMTGATVMTMWQLVYTLPRWQTLVASPMQASSATPAYVVALLVALAGGFTVHVTVTSKVIQTSGALAVGVINAFRSAVIAGISHLMFCSPSRHLQCLTPTAAASSAVVSLGVLCWSMPGTSSVRSAPAAVPDTAVADNKHED